MASGDTLLWFEPKNNDPPASSYATLDTRNSHPVLDFDGAADEEAVFPFVMPSNYAGGGIAVDIFYMMTSATSGTIRFQVSVERDNAGGTDLDSDSFATAISNGGTVPGTSGVVGVVTVPLTHSEIDGLQPEEPGRLKIRRDADGTTGTDDVTTDLEFFRAHVKEA